MKKLTRPLFLLLMILGLIFLTGVAFSPQQSLSRSEIFNGQKVEIILKQPTHYGQAVLFQNNTYDTFGVAPLKRHLGLFWFYDGGTYGYDVEENEPFKAAGIWTRNEKAKEQFIIGIKINNQDIKHIAIGKDPKLPSSLDVKYDLTLREVKEKSDIYKVTDVKGDFALIVTDDYNEESWNITAFDKDGKLVADKPFGSDSRIINNSK